MLCTTRGNRQGASFCFVFSVLVFPCSPLIPLPELVWFAFIYLLQINVQLLFFSKCKNVVFPEKGKQEIKLF